MRTVGAIATLKVLGWVFLFGGILLGLYYIFVIIQPRPPGSHIPDPVLGVYGIFASGG